MASREKRIQVFEQTMRMCAEDENMRKAVATMKAEQRIIWQEDDEPAWEAHFEKPTKLVISQKRSFEAARPYAMAGKRVCVLNFASSVSPGGGVTRGTQAQEESLCRVSSLYAALSDDGAKPFYDRHWEMIQAGTMKRENRDDCIFTPGVVVVCEDDGNEMLLEPSARYTVDVITCAAPDLRYTTESSRYNPTHEELADLFLRRWRRILAVAAANNADVVILGAFGCGVFGNPPELVANAAAQALTAFEHCFETVEFAIYSPSYESRNFSAFSHIEGIRRSQSHNTGTEAPHAMICINIDAVNKTQQFIHQHGWGLRDEDIHDHYLTDKSELFGGGCGGRCGYKIFCYALKYISYSNIRMRYRYMAGALLTIWGYARFNRNQWTVDEYFRWITELFLTHHEVHDEYFMYSKLSKEMLVKIERSYREDSSIEALTMLKVLKALEWDDAKAERLSHDMKENRFR